MYQSCSCPCPMGYHTATCASHHPLPAAIPSTGCPLDTLLQRDKLYVELYQAFGALRASEHANLPGKTYPLPPFHDFQQIGETFREFKTRMGEAL